MKVSLFSSTKHTASCSPKANLAGAIQEFIMCIHHIKCKFFKNSDSSSFLYPLLLRRPFNSSCKYASYRGCTLTEKTTAHIFSKILLLNSILYSERVQNNPIVATKKLLLLYMRSGEPKPDVRRSTFGLNHGNHKIPPGVVGHFQNQEYIQDLVICRTRIEHSI